MQGKMKTYRGSCHCGKIQFEIKSTLETSPAVQLLTVQT
jgi:hypothetical protein